MEPKIDSSSNLPAASTTQGTAGSPDKLSGRAVSAAAAAVAAVGLARRAAADPFPAPPFFLQIFLRGGADGLTLVPPYNDPQYQTRRAATKLDPPGSGGNEALPLAGSSTFGLAPGLAPLTTLFGENKVHFVHATGPADDTRSHFVQQDLVERGETLGSIAHQSGLPMGLGWLGRHLQIVPPISGSTGNLRALSLTANPVATLRGGKAGFTTTPHNFLFPGTSTSTTRQGVLDTLYSSFGGATIGDGILVKNAMANDLGIIDRLSRVLFTRTPTLPPGVAYAPAGIGSMLKAIADIVHDPDTANEIEVANIDMGGWDTHFDQGVVGSVGSGRMANLMSALGNSLLAFQRDLENQPRPFCVLVMTEFGRTTDENSGQGTDHGSGGAAIVQASAGVLAGPARVHAPGWTGLPAQGDLLVATDIRHVMTEILQQFLGNVDPRAMHSFGAPSHYQYSRQFLLN